MQNKFIIDKEIDLNENDFLKTKIYADNLTKIIKNTEPDKVFTIGLFGKWGTGKSSIIKTSQRDFDEKKIKFITYDAWQYVNDSFRRMFLRKLREELRYEETDDIRRFYENESKDMGETYKFNWKNIPISIIILSILFIGCIITIHYIGENSWKKGLTLSALVSFISLLITIFQGLVHKIKISVTKPHLFAPEQFEDCYNEIVSNSLSKSNKTLKWVKRDNSIQGLEKLVIVIDNIDRCSSDIAYNLLTDIKTFLGSGPYSIVFVIPVDDEALKKHIINNNKTDADCDNEKEEFLRKFFNVVIRIKPYAETDMYAFTEKICKKAQLNFKPETINIASKEFAQNPRRTIQLFNNLLSEMNFYDTAFIEKNETLICCILIIREEYPDYYKTIVSSPKIFNDDPPVQDDRIRRFIRIAQTAVGSVSISDLRKVLTNSYLQFDNIPLDIKDAIETFDVETILKIWDNDKETLSGFLIDRLDSTIKNNLTETDMVAYFDLCAEINNKYSLEKYFAKRIDEKIQPYLLTVIQKTKNHENLCRYALLREKQNDKKIKNVLIENTKRSEHQDKGEHWSSLFNAMLKVFQDKKTSYELSSTYTISHNSVESIDFSEEQVEHLLTQQYVQDRIGDLPVNNKEIILDTETKEYQKVKWILEKKKNLTGDTYEHLFNKIIGTDDNSSRMRGKTIDDVARLLSFTNPLLSLIPDRKLNTQPQTLYYLIVQDRQVRASAYMNNNQNLPIQAPFYENKNFIDECTNEKKYLQEITEFVINIYRITNNQTSVSKEIDKLVNHADLNNEFIQLINKQFTLHPILNSIFDSINDFNDNNKLLILKHCFNQTDSKKAYSIDEQKAKTKLNELLEYAQTQKSDEAFTLLETLIEQEQYKNLLTTLIIVKDSAFINSLPHKLLELAVSSFNRDNYNDYANNFEFLSVIIKNGSNQQKRDIVKILTEKIDINQDVDKVFNLINSMEDIQSFDESKLLRAHLESYQRENKENISQEINEKIEQLKEKAN